MKKFFAILYFLLLQVALYAQYGLSFYHLKDATFQSNLINPSYFPQGKVFIGLPVLSGINVYANNRFSYNDIFTKREDGSNLIDINRAVKTLGIRNNLSFHTNINLFHFGIRLPNGVVFSLMMNERIAADILYPKQIAKWAWEGNGRHVGETIDLNPMAVSVNHFREIGLGMGLTIPDTKIKVGGRVKYLQGVANISTPSKFKGKVQTNIENYQLSFDWKDGSVRTAGLNELGDGNIGYILLNGNRGFGIDLGIDYPLNKYYSVSLALNDVGFISWKEDIKNYKLNDTTFLYTGIELKGARNYFDGIDTLRSKLKYKENNSAYLSMIPASLIGSFIYSPRVGTDITTTINTRIIQKQPKIGIGVGIRQYISPRLIVSGSLVRLPQQMVNIGAAFTVSAGFAQLYAGVDKVLGYNIPNMQWAEFRVGMNFVFGLGRKKEKETQQYVGLYTQSKGVPSSTFMGHKIKAKGQDGLYTIIKKRKLNDAGTITPEVINDDKYRKNIKTSGGDIEDELKRLPVKSATGDLNQTETNVSPPKSASGKDKTVVTKPKVKSNSGKRKDVVSKTNVKSASGKNKSVEAPKNIKTSSGKEVHATKQAKVRSASGKSVNKSKKEKVRSSSGRQSQSKKKSKIRSSSGNKNSSSKKGKIRSSSSVKNDKPKRRKKG